MQNTHEFFCLLRKYKIDRQQRLRITPQGHAEQISVDQLRKIFETVAERDISIMLFALSLGRIQIHTEPVKKLVSVGSWYNVLDPEFNMYLRENQINNIWVTRKPMKDGIVTGLDLFNKEATALRLYSANANPALSK